MTKTALLLILSICILASGCMHPFSVKSAATEIPQPIGNLNSSGLVNESENLEKLGIEIVSDYPLLPEKGTSQVIPWSSGYWPDIAGSISRRWQEKDIWKQVRYKKQSLEEMQKLPQDIIAKLSPAEKFDLWNGDSQLSLSKASRQYSESILPVWSGICHGVAIASILHPEPKPQTLRSKNGKLIPFGSSDIKALLSYYYGRQNQKSFIAIGKRCTQVAPKKLSKECQDLNPGTFHLLLTNYIGLHQKAFILDISWDYMIWNYAVYDYKTTLKGKFTISKNEDLKRLKALVKSKGLANIDFDRLTHVDQIIEARTVIKINKSKIEDSWHPTSKHQVGESIPYRYLLFLDKEAKIIGGEWLSYERPDFAWIPVGGKVDNNRELKFFLAGNSKNPFKVSP